MTRVRGPLPSLLLMVMGTLIGLVLLEAGARAWAVKDDRKQGRLDGDLSAIAAPKAGSTVTLGQIIRKSRDERVVYELRSRLDVLFAGGHLTTSDAGFRGDDVTIPKPPGAFRIVGIGDSYMFGQGVSDDDTYLSRLRGLMAGSMPGRLIETANLATPGYNTVMEVASLKARWADVKGDLILIEIVGNDLDLPNFLWTSLDPWTLRRSFLFDFVQSRLAPPQREGGGVAGLTEAPAAERKGTAETFSRELEHVPARYASMVGLSAFETAIRELSEFGRARDVPVLAVSHGVWFEADMMRILEGNRIPTLILRPALRRRARLLGAPDYARSPLALSSADLHPSALGHQVVAEELAAWIPTHVPLVVKGPSTSLQDALRHQQ